MAGHRFASFSIRLAVSPFVIWAIGAANRRDGACISFFRKR
jgi:hypothetical protein